MKSAVGGKCSLWKSTAFLVLFCFTTTTVVWADPSFGSGLPHLSLYPFQSTLKRLTLPSHLGRIDEVFLPEHVYPDAQLIVYLQDAHTNLGAQKNIGAIARELGEKLKLEAILVEGGSGELDFGELRAFPDRNIKERATDFWLREAVLNGIEREAVVGSREFRFFGIEDPHLYSQGGAYFLEAFERSKTFLESLEPFRARNEAQKKKVYNEDLARFDRTTASFQGKEKLTALVGYLANEARNRHINRWKYLELEKVIDLILLEMEGGNPERFFQIAGSLDAQKFSIELEHF